MAKKATHSGECQICGRKQKLPGGCLSKHGYTKEFGFFSGTCPGSDNLPFELSKDRIEPVVIAREQQLAEIRQEIQSLNDGELHEGNVAWVHHYFGGRFSRGYYLWIEAEIVAEQVEYDGHKFFRFTYKAEEKSHKIDLPYNRDLQDSLDNARKYLNQEYARRHLEVMASNIAGYVKWQRERLANWTPKELTPVESVAV